MWFTSHCFSTCSCYIKAKNGICINDVWSYNWRVSKEIMAYHLFQITIWWTSNHGLYFACKLGILNLCFGIILIIVIHCLCHICCCCGPLRSMYGILVHTPFVPLELDHFVVRCGHLPLSLSIIFDLPSSSSFGMEKCWLSLLDCTRHLAFLTSPSC